jgi:hypothetical protein
MKVTPMGNLLSKLGGEAESLGWDLEVAGDARERVRSKVGLQDHGRLSLA